MCSVVEHGGYLAGSLAQFFIFHYHDGDTGHGQILLRTGIDGIIFLDVNRSAKDVGRHIGYHGDSHV